MTDISPDPVQDDDGVATGEAADVRYWEIAAQIMEERPLWVVIWLSREHRFRAYPKFPRPPA